jgi:hypothetical protein
MSEGAPTAAKNVRGVFRVYISNTLAFEAHDTPLDTLCAAQLRGFPGAAIGT